MNTLEIISFILEKEEKKAGTFAKEIGVKPTQIYDLQSGKIKRISEGIANKILLAFPQYNKAWLLSGEGDPIKKNTENEAVSKIIEFENFPLVSQRAYAGYLSGYADPEYVETLPTVAFPVDHTPLGKYLVFEVKGDSMNDGSYESYLDGDLLLCREVSIDFWKDLKLNFTKWDFVIVHTEGVIIKRIIDHDVANHTITIHSLNPDKTEYPDKVIDLSDVKQILNVVNMMRPRKR